MDKTKEMLEKLVRQLGRKQTITPAQACNAIKIYNKQIITKTLKELYNKGFLIKRGPGEVYSLNPRLRKKA